MLLKLRSTLLLFLILILVSNINSLIENGEQPPSEGSLETGKDSIITILNRRSLERLIFPIKNIALLLLITDKRASFYVGSRYGRSEGKHPSYSTAWDQLTPRVERFYLSSRYGKRATTDYLPEFMIGENNEALSSAILTCTTNGAVSKYFYCNPL